MNAPCSGEICIIEMPPSSAVSSISACCTASGGVPCATRYCVDLRREEERLRCVGHRAERRSGARSVRREVQAGRPVRRGPRTGRYLAYSPRWGAGDGSGARSRSRRSRPWSPRPARASGRRLEPRRPVRAAHVALLHTGKVLLVAGLRQQRRRLQRRHVHRPASGTRRPTRSSPSPPRGTRSAPATRSCPTASCSSPAAPPRTRARRRTTRTPARTKTYVFDPATEQVRRRGPTWRSPAGTRPSSSSATATSSPSAASTRTGLRTQHQPDLRRHARWSAPKAPPGRAVVHADVPGAAPAAGRPALLLGRERLRRRARRCRASGTHTTNAWTGRARAHRRRTVRDQGDERAAPARRRTRR